MIWVPRAKAGHENVRPPVPSCLMAKLKMAPALSPADVKVELVTLPVRVIANVQEPTGLGTKTGVAEYAVDT